MFALGAREAVVAAVRGRDAGCFGAAAEPEEMLRALESCGLAGSVTGVSVRVPMPAGPVRDQVATAERVRVVAHAHGWRPHSDNASPDSGGDSDGDHVTISPASP